ncbi:hypothetical protein [Mycobacteroides abscessus]|uniref:Uncharacterized protein n=1 Tax=Mycobacteroides abscessus subsp. abscessus TaxID=1185650 RepID=A0AB38D7M5_9MYCO|nr:hypothetical protein [Mycobacteroides abscessus]SIC22289.1 Uncharacterised protein [Mycobacteroides abscessus subsp. abscessus]SIC25097.1 Uncharacterised protein [Mycobacteroides abscessus subsp. abscessus]SIC34294.1 Uncharacterised protein [Mycobacteroides abscessus subsp. abscessus]SIC42121.1 Uncharacterised protein [Mycobacteroides abscessus subsp. abscessus]SKR84220.1 Uncharacterised protein [Mycobacteroides abscessus subsp. abscessus]
MNYYKPHRFVRLYPEVRACWDPQRHVIAVSWEGYSVELTRALQHDIPRSLRWWNPTAQCWFVRDLWAAPLHQILRTHGEIRAWDVPETLERKAS